MNRFVRAISPVFRWRIASVVLLSFSSGLPLGLVWIAIPDWLRDQGVDIRLVGLFTLTQAPWTFKFLWAPFMDRYVPGFWGRRRGWMAVAQCVLLGTFLGLAGVTGAAEAILVVFALALAIAVASASQDIALDAWAVEALAPEEQGVAVGARHALYRAAMLVSGGGAISLAASFGFGTVNALLALLFLPMLLVTWRAPDTDADEAAPTTLKDAVWKPFLEALARPRALEILAFVFFYKFADNLAQSLTRPFLVDMGYSGFHRGVALSTIGLIAAVGSTFAGGIVTTLIGLGPALWLFGLLQIVSNLGYFFVAGAGGSLAWMYGATAFELLSSGLGTGAFSVLLLRITDRRFSATQYALFSSLFALPRILAGPVTGYAVDALGWRTFFLSTMAMGIPGLLLLHRFSPLGIRDPQFHTGGAAPSSPGAGARELWPRIALGAAFGGALSLLIAAALTALRTLREYPDAEFSLAAGLVRVLHPGSVPDVIQLLGILTLALVSGLLVGAFGWARRERS